MSGGGGGGPSQTTTVTSNIPEYARPYVENMLEAGQRQLFNTADGQITGFKAYQPYSTDPSQYFAGPSGLQQSTYQEASGMTTPGQYAPATGIAGLAGMGQLGAGAQYTAGVTSPSAVQSYMSPYQQAVTDVAKTAAVREAQMADKAARLGSVRQGTYGGARELLGRSERERNLLSNLSNIQAQGSQSAYDRAIQAQQFGANLGLQGLAGATQTASTLGQLGGAQQQADIARMELQNKLGGQQQQYQQGIINQAIQDYATAQQYPYMQLSTMSNLLRGLPMQGMSTQQYQAQPSTTQQLLGLAGTGASLYGAFKREGGAIKEYKAGGIAEDLRAKLEDMADTDPQGLKRLVAKSSSREVKEMGNEILSGIAAANTGKLGTNMAGGGIVAFQGGGLNDPMGLQNDAEPGYGFSVSSLGDILGALGTEEEWQKALRLKRHGIEYTPKKGFDKEGLPIGSRFSKEKPAGGTDSDYQAFDAATAEFEKERAKKNVASPASPAAPASGGGAGRESVSGLQAYLDERKKLLGVDGPGEKSQALMKALEERQAGMGKERETDRYLRAAEAFAKFGSTAGPMLKGASEALGGFAKGEAAARREEDKIKLEGMKMQSDLEKAQRAEARGDLDAAEKFYNSAQDRANRIQVANIGAGAQGQTARFEKEAIERVMADKGVDFATALQMVRGAGRQESVELQGAKASLDYIKNRLTFLDPKKDAEEIKKLKAAEAQILGQLNKSGGTSGGSGKVIDFNAIK